MARKKKETLAQVQAKAGSMAWLMTFADLMSLLMAFFVILFALSEVDKEKFKQLGYSLKQAFGVPTPVQLSTNEKTKVIDPATSKDKKSSDHDSVKKDQRQVKDVQPITKFKNSSSQNAGKTKIIAQQKKTKPQPNNANDDKKNKGSSTAKNKKADKAMAAKLARTKRDVKSLKKIFQNEVERKVVDIEQKGQKIIIRLYGAGSFKSGGAELTPQIKETLARFADSLNYIKGTITVSGHTDDRPISTYRYRSNWELSATRATAIIHALMNDLRLKRDRFSMRAHADTKNLVPNDSDVNRSKNRRIEIMIDQSQVKTLISGTGLKISPDN